MEKVLVVTTEKEEEGCIGSAVSTRSVVSGRIVLRSSPDTDFVLFERAILDIGNTTGQKTEVSTPTSSHFRGPPRRFEVVVGGGGRW